MTHLFRLSKKSSMSINMASKINLVTVTVFVTYFISVSSAQNTENIVDHQFLDRNVSNESLFYGNLPEMDSDKIYAGPLKSSDIDEVIVVSRDNVQQLIKTILLAYTHSKDPTMAHLLKSGGLGALKTTFKYLGKEDLGDSFLSTAQMFIEDLNLEDEEEKVLGEFAEEYLSKHKFKVVVPESFLLHEKEMLEFLDMKKKMSRKKGRSMPEPEVTEPLELTSVMPYNGKQFSSSIIPGLDLTWIALLGGMLAIPYYFWSEDNNSPTSRKDNNVAPPLPSLSPPIFAPGSPLHERPRKKNGKRQRRPNVGQVPPPFFVQGAAPGNPNQIPSEGDQKAAYDKQYRNWYNDYFHQQFNQFPPGVIPPPGEANTLILPPVNALPPQGLNGGPQFGLGVPPFNAAGQVGNPVSSAQQNIIGPSPFGMPHPNQFPLPQGMNQKQFNRNFVAGMVPPPNHLGQNTPEYVQDPSRVDARLSAEQEQQESVQRPQIQVPPSGQLSAPGPNQAQGQLQVPPQNQIEGQPRNQFGNHPPRHNFIFNANQNEQKDAFNAPPPAKNIQSEVGLLPPPPPGPPTNPHIPPQQQLLQQQLQSQQQQQQHQQQQQQQKQQERGVNPAPFIPTHVEKETALNAPPNLNKIQGPVFINHPQQRLQQGLGPNRRNPQLGQQGVFPVGQPVPWLGFPPPHLQQQQLRPFPNGPILHPGLQRVPGPGNQNGVANFNGIRGVPQGLQNSLFSDPLLPPPPPGSGEKRDTFGSFRPDREGNSHFKVSFGANEISEENEEVVEEEEIKEDNEISRAETNDGVPQASVAQPTVVVIRPQNTLQNNQLQNNQLQKNNILDLSQNFRRFPHQALAPPQTPQVNIVLPQRDQPLQGLAQNLPEHRQPNLSLQEQKQILQEQLRKQQKQSGHILPQHLVGNQELSSEQIQQLIKQSQEQEQVKQQSSQQRQSSEQQQQQQLQQQLQKQQQQQLLEQQRLEQQSRQELQQQQLIHHQQAQIHKQRELQRVSVERQRLSQEQQKEIIPSSSPSPFHNDHDGFIPIHGPPTVPHGILSKPPAVQVLRPSAFLDKLMAEHDENKSNIEITYAEPLSFSSEVVRIKESSADRLSKEVARPTPTTTSGPTALFIHKPTARTGVPELQNPGRSQSVRVVTSKSVVTSRPVPLGKRYPSTGSENRNSAKENEVLPNEEEEEDEIFYDDEEKYTTPATHNRGSVKYAQIVNRKATAFDSLEELLPNYEQDYREVLREYQRKQLEPQDQQQVYDQVVKASEQLEHYVPAPQEVIEMNSAGFVNTDEGDKAAAQVEVNRRLKAASMSVEAADEKTRDEGTTVRESKQSDPSVPVYALDPFYGPRLSRIDAIFFQMKLDEDEEGCREQVVCNMYKNPDVYTPLSDFLSRQLTVTLEELQKPQVADERILRFFRYLQAARTGQDGGDCLAKYPKCAHDTTRLSHKPILDAFHKVSDLMNHENYSN